MSADRTLSLPRRPPGLLGAALATFGAASPPRSRASTTC